MKKGSAWTTWRASTTDKRHPQPLPCAGLENRRTTKGPEAPDLFNLENQTMTTFKKFADNAGLTLTTQPERHVFNWKAKEYRYRCKLAAQDNAEPMEFDYTMGAGLLEKRKGQKWVAATLPFSRHGMTVHDARVFASQHRPRLPSLDDVLLSLALDSRALDLCFEDWADDYGYDTDSREAERIYRLCVEQGLKLRAMLGWSRFNELLNCEEE